MSAHTLGLITFVVLAGVLVLLFAAGPCESEMRHEKEQHRPSQTA